MNRVNCNPRFRKARPNVANGLNQIFNELMNSTLGDIIQPEVSSKRPFVNIREDEDQITLEMALPGVNKEDVDISTEKKQLIISKKKSEVEVKEDFKRKEFDYSSFERIFNIPNSINIAEINASFEAGILKITLPKKEDAKIISKKIEIV